MGAEGKITTDVMYGVTSQLAALREEAELMPATASDGFVLLNNAVFKFIGNADEAIGSSNDLATALIAIADAIDRAPDEPWFDRVFGDLGDEVAKTVNATYRELVAIGTALDYISNTSPGKTLDDIAAFGEGDATKGIRDFELALGDAEQAVANLASNTVGRFGEVDAAVQDLFQQILEGRGSVASAHKAVDALASVNPEFAALKAGVLSVIDHFFAMRDAANAANAAAASTTTDLGSFPTRRQFKKDFGPDLTIDGAPGGPIRPSSSGGKGKSPTQKYGDDLDAMRRRIEMLKEETALTAALNPLLNDYGYAKAELTARQDLENAAKKAGLVLGPEQQAELRALAAGYAQATVEAAKLAEAQNATVKQMEELRDASRQALDTIIDGFLEGKDAGEIFGNVLKDIGKQLITMDMNGLFGNGQGANPFGFIGKALGFDNGGYTGPGGKKQPAGVVHKGEVVWSQRDIARAGGVGVVEAMRRGMGGYDNGGVVAMPRLPSIPARESSFPSLTFAPTFNAPGADAAGLTGVRDELRSMRAAMPSIAKKAYQDMRKYGQVR